MRDVLNPIVRRDPRIEKMARLTFQTRRRGFKLSGSL
jgi:hypothetical protein